MSRPCWHRAQVLEGELAMAIDEVAEEAKQVEYERVSTSRDCGRTGPTDQSLAGGRRLAMDNVGKRA
jgi:hypothetical protein